MANGVEIGPIEVPPGQGDLSPKEAELRREQKVHRQLVKVVRDFAEGKITKEEHDRAVNDAHYRLRGFRTFGF